MVVTAGLTVTAVPLLTAPTPLSMLPFPLLKTAVSWALPPATILVGLATKLVMTGDGGAPAPAALGGLRRRESSRGVWRR